MFNRSLLANAIGLVFVSSALNAAELVNKAVTPNKANATLEKMVIIGSSEQAKTLPGSGAVIDNKQLETEVSTDINQVLKTVPGVYVLEEEGSGLRPNIGIRGATGERSKNITLLEDGILVAPAPYADPAAYYFPTMLRMHSVEVLKGAPLLRYGPQTTGGIVNLVSSPIPEENGGSLTFGVGDNGMHDTHVNYGGKSDQWSWLLETVKRDSAGFKAIDRSNRDSGFDISDYVAKLGWQSVQGPKQNVLLKFQRSLETSNETYVGLTDSDFDKNPNRRYSLSSLDQMNNDHTGMSLLYSLALTDSVTAGTTIYRNEFARDWFKLDGSGAIIDAANGGDVNAQGILDGTVDSAGLRYKHNNRDYFSQGIELNFDLDLGLHQLQTGSRIHEDEVDRFQPVEVYDQVDGSLVFASITQPGAGDNRVGSADALAFWVKDDWQVNEQLNVNLSLRYEDVETKELRYGVVDRSTVASQKDNDGSIWLPGASFTFDFNEHWQMLAGVHRGFTPLPAGSAENEDPETSVNWELGARYRLDPLFAELIGFYSDFSNKAESCSVGAPCSNGAESGTFKTGEAVITGLEMQVGSQFDRGAFTIPVSVAYTFTQAESSADNAVSAVQDGDRLKDVPENILSARVGVEHTNGLRQYLVAKYLDDMCVTIGCNRVEAPQSETDELFVVDYIGRYALNKNTDAFVKVENVFDEQKIVARTPDGARPNKPLSVTVGMKLDF